MIILTEQDKKNITNMITEATKYYVYPNEIYSEEYIKEWMKNI